MEAFLGIFNFSLIQAFNAWNVSVDEFRYRGRGDVIIHNKLMKWELYYTLDEELLA